MIRFIHTADIHIGVENYGHIDPKTGIHTRLLDFKQALNTCIDFALQENVDFFLFSGDAYKTAHPSPTHQRIFFEALLRLFQAKIPVVMIVGNHDQPISFGKAHALELFGQLPLEGFHVIAQPKTITLTTKQGPVTIVGIPWPSRSTLALQKGQASPTETEFSPDEASLSQAISQALGSIIRTAAEQIDPNIHAVLAGHLTVANGVFSGSEKRAIYGDDPTLLPSQLALHPFDYVALGHLHRHQNLNPHGYPAVNYSGSLERIDFGERKEEKGFCYVTMHEKGKTTYEFIPVSTRPFLQIDVHIDTKRSFTEQIVEAVRKQPLNNTVVKIVYYLPADTKDNVDITAVQNAASMAHYLVGIFPVRPVEQKQRRAHADVSMSFEELLTTYFATKPEWQNQLPELIKKAQELKQRIVDAAKDS